MRKGRSFEEWLARVDVWLFAKIGLSHRDLPDIDYLSMYEDGEAPALHPGLEPGRLPAL